MRGYLKNKMLRATLSILIVFLTLQGKAPAKTKELKEVKKTTLQDSKALKKDWNYIVYITANNDLNKFAYYNIAQMLQIGSTEYINILVQLDTYGKREVSRYYIEHNNPILIDTQSNSLESTTGTPQSLYKFAEWAIKTFPAKHNALILWNHGSGIEDPSIWGKKKSFYPHDMFKLNTKTGLMELDQKLLKKRGIAFNEIFETYLTNQDLKLTLESISRDFLGGKKIDIIGMDACNMAMLEIGTQIKNTAKYMVGSEEIEPGTGWNYARVLQPFLTETLTPERFAQHIVQAYNNEYKHSYGGVSQSAINLANYNDLEENLNDIASTLLNLISSHNKDRILRKLKQIRSSYRHTTSFANKSYIDMHHFYKSLLEKIELMDLELENTTQVNTLKKLLSAGIALIEDAVTANTSSATLPNARGISFYYPTTNIHESYLKTEFAQNNQWINFIDKYIKETKWYY